jgi:hypothetical protein
MINHNQFGILLKVTNIKNSPQKIVDIFKGSIFKNIFSLIFLCSIDAIERISRITLIFVFIHFVISYSEYSGAFEIPKYGNLEHLIYFSLILLYAISSFYHHRYILNKDKFKYDFIKSAEWCFKYLKKINAPHYLTFNKFIMLGSTLLQYLGLLILPIFFGYLFLSVISFIIIFLFVLINLLVSRYTTILQHISISLSQTVLFLVHLGLIGSYSLYFYQHIDIFVVVYLFALRLCLLYMGQLVEYSVGFFVSVKKHGC